MRIKPSFAQLAGDRSKYAGPSGFAFFTDQNRGVVIKSNIGPICPSRLFPCTNDYGTCNNHRASLPLFGCASLTETTMVSPSLPYLRLVPPKMRKHITFRAPVLSAQFNTEYFLDHVLSTYCAFFVISTNRQRLVLLKGRVSTTITSSPVSGLIVLIVCRQFWNVFA